MLAHLSVNNFAIVKSLQLELSKGMRRIAFYICVELVYYQRSILKVTKKLLCN